MKKIDINFYFIINKNTNKLGKIIMNLMYIYKFSPENILNASMPSFGVDILYLLYSNLTIELFTISLLFLYIHLVNPFYHVSYVSNHLVICWYIHTRKNHLLQT